MYRFLIAVLSVLTLLFLFWGLLNYPGLSAGIGIGLCNILLFVQFLRIKFTNDVFRMLMFRRALPYMFLGYIVSVPGFIFIMLNENEFLHARDLIYNLFR